MNKVVTRSKAMEKFADGQTIMIGGFLAVGTPDGLVDALVDKKAKDLILITNDTAVMDKGVGKLIVNKQIRKITASHIGTNPETGRQMNAGEIIVELIPQGTFAERIRCGGSGLGGILTPTGVGTVVAEGKQIIILDGKEYILERPLKAELALIKADKADTAGNLVFRRAARNFNPLMAMAADFVIAEVEEIVEIGELDPDEVMTPGVLIDMVVKAGEENI